MSFSHLRHQRGLAEIELAILLPFALLLWWLMTDLSLWVQQQQRLQQLSYDWVMLLASQPAEDSAADPVSAWQPWLAAQWPDTDMAPAYTVLRWSSVQPANGQPAQQQWRHNDCPAERQQQQLQRLLLTTQGDNDASTFWVVNLCVPLPGFLIRRFIPARDPVGLRANSITVQR